jgi:hypothetical protein
MLEGVDYQWSNGEKTKSITVKQSGIYNLIVTDASGCKSRSKPVVVNVLQIPPISIRAGSGFPVCEGDQVNVELSAPLGFKSYIWSNGATDRKIIVTQLGNYYVSATTNDGCFTTSEIFEIKINPNPPKPSITQIGSRLQASEATSYQWYFNNKPITGAKSRVIDVTELGFYSVEAFDEIGCSTMSDPLNVISSIDEMSVFSNIIVSPNPAMDKLNIKIFNLNGDFVNIQIFNLFGETLIESHFQAPGSFNENINISNIARGIYFIKILNNNNNFILKFIKK